MKKTLMILASAALFVCCGEDSKTEDTFTPQSISISADTIAADADGTIAANSVTVTSSGEWVLTGDTSWCTPSAVEGGNGATVTFAADINEGDEFRSANFYFICGDATRKLTVTQSAAIAVELLNGETFSLDSFGGVITMKVNSNSDIGSNFTISEDWVALSSLPGGTSGTQWIQFNVASHQNFEDREAVITLFSDTQAETKITIAQGKYVGVRIDTISDHEFGMAGGSITVTASGNVDFNASISAANSAWLSATEILSSVTDIITKTFQIDCVNTQFYRVGEITLVPTSTGTSSTVNIKQTVPNPKLFDVPDSLFASQLVSLGFIVANGDKYELTYQGYTATSISISPGSGNAYAAIASIEGIEQLENLTTITLSNMNVRKMDFSKNTKLVTLTNNYVPLEELILGDVNLTTRSISYLYNNRSNSNRAQSFTLSSSKVTTLTLSQTSSTTYDEVVWIDITGCPALRTLTANRSSGKLKNIYLTQAQKDAYDGGTLTITTNAAFDKTTGIVVR